MSAPDAYERAQAERRRGPPVVHRLKTWPVYFGAVLAGTKPFEVRKADRDFMLGDMLLLEEWDPETEGFTGASIVREVTYMLKGGQFGIAEGYVVLGLRRLP